MNMHQTDCNCEYCAGPNLADIATLTQTIVDLQRQAAEFAVERARLNDMITRPPPDDETEYKSSSFWQQKFTEATGTVTHWRNKHDELADELFWLKRRVAKLTRKKPAKPKRKV